MCIAIRNGRKYLSLVYKKAKKQIQPNIPDPFYTNVLVALVTFFMSAPTYSLNIVLNTISPK